MPVCVMFIFSLLEKTPGHLLHNCQMSMLLEKPLWILTLSVTRPLQVHNTQDTQAY